jgi:hypothetical protein
MRIVALLLTVSLTAAIALAQQSVPPPPQPVANQAPAPPPPAVNPPAVNPPAANGPTLEATLKFIQEKVNQQGKIVYVETVTDSVTGESAGENYPAARPAGGLARQSAFASKKGYAAGGGSAPQRSAETQVVVVDPIGGALSFQENGSDSELQKAGWGIMLPVSSDWTKTWSVYFKNIEKLEVLSSPDYKHRANPAMTYQDDPSYFELVIHLAGGKSVARHIQTTPSGRRGRTVESDDSIHEFALHFRDEDTANRAAKAMVHAVELCGGGSQPEPF